MTIHDLLPRYALGAVDAAEADELERALAADPDLAAALRALRAATAELASALPGVAPSPSVRARLLASTTGRLEGFVDRFAQLFEVGPGRARRLLDLVDDPQAWGPGPGPGSWLIHFDASPALAGADVGFVRLAPGHRFARHRHAGREHCLVLAGHAHDSLAGDLGPGAEAIAEAGTEHDVATVGADDLVFAVWVWGVDFG